MRSVTPANSVQHPFIPSGVEGREARLTTPLEMNGVQVMKRERGDET